MDPPAQAERRQTTLNRNSHTFTEKTTARLEYRERNSQFQQRSAKKVQLFTVRFSVCE